MYAIANRTSVHVRRNYLTVSLVGLFVAEQQGEVQPPLYLDSLKHTLGRMQTLQQSSAPSSLTAPGRHTPRFNGYRFATLDSNRHKWLVHRPLLETATNHFYPPASLVDYETVAKCGVVGVWKRNTRYSCRRDDNQQGEASPGVRIG